MSTSIDTVRADLARLHRGWRAAELHGGRTIGAAIEHTAVARPDVELVFDTEIGRSIVTVGEIAVRASRLAGGLAARGLVPGDRLLVQMPNSVEQAVTVAAAFWYGLVVVPVIHIYGPRELEEIVTATDAAAIVTPGRWRGIDFYERVAATPRGSCLHIVSGDRLAGAAGNEVGWNGLAEAQPIRRTETVGSGELAVVIFTSGTTSGLLKGAMHTHDTFLARIPSDGASLGTHLSPSPAGHIAGLLFTVRALVSPVPTLFMDSWDAGRALQLCLDHHPDRMNGAPFFITSLFDEEDRTGTTNQWPTCFHTGGASVAPALIERGEQRGRCGWRTYGSSEVPGATESSADDPLGLRAGTDGVPTPGAEVRVVDADEVDLPEGAEGEILVRAPQMFVGYLQRDDLTAASFAPGGWFRTGDLGTFVNGRLAITGRSKDIVIRGGENISAKEVEDTLLRHPAVIEAAVVALPDARYGERVCAALRLDGPTSLSVDEVGELFVRCGMARQKTPEVLVVFDDFPRTASGKVRKDELLRAVLVRLDAEPTTDNRKGNR